MQKSKFSHQDAQDFKDNLLAFIDKNDKATYDLGNVETMSLSCIQILLAATRKIERDEKEINFIFSSDLKAIIDDLGLSPQLTTQHKEQA